MTKQLGSTVCQLQALVLFDFKVSACCLQVLQAHFVMTHEFHFHLAFSEDVKFHSFTCKFGFNSISNDKWWKIYN